MPKGPLKTPFVDYVVPKGDVSGDGSGYHLDGDASIPLLIGWDVKGQPTPELLQILGKK